MAPGRYVIATGEVGAYVGDLRLALGSWRQQGGALSALVTARCLRSRCQQIVYSRPYIHCRIPQEYFRPITGRSDLVLGDLYRVDRHGGSDSAATHEGPERIHSVLQAIIWVMMKMVEKADYSMRV